MTIRRVAPPGPAARGSWAPSPCLFSFRAWTHLVVVVPEIGTKDVLLDLPGGGSGEVVNQQDRLWPLERCEPLSHCRLDLGRRQVAAGVWDHQRSHCFDPAVVRQPDHRDLLDAGVALVDRSLDLQGSNVLAGALDDVLCSVFEPQHPGLVEVAQVPGVEPATRYRLRGGLVVVEVALQRLWAAIDDLA